MSTRPSFFAELKRRNVLRAGVLYAGAVWALAQGIAQLGPSFGAPDWITRWFVIAGIVGFPFWLAFAWFYEFTPSGLKRESEIDPGDSIAHHTGRKLNIGIFGVMAVAIVLLVTNQFVLRRDATSVANQGDAKAVAATLARVPEKSVAVLPFANESGDPKQAYFSDGLSEELITDLTQISALKVIGKYSSFQFRDSKDSPAQIGATLGVAHLIEGSVRQAGNELRITVNLIRASDGSSMWSHAYDRPLKDVFAIQSEIGTAVVDALKIKLVGATLVDPQKPPSGNVEAYQWMLQGRAQARRNTQADFEQGITLLEKAVQLDPDYAYAWSVLANVRINLGTQFLGGDARQQAIAKARTDLDRATALAPDAAFVHRQRGYLLSVVDHDQAGALKEMQRALALAPNDGTVMNFLSAPLATMGQPQQAADLMRKAIATDPLRADWYVGLSQSLMPLGRIDEAEQAARKAVALQPRNPRNYGFLSTILGARGEFDQAEQAARQAVTLQPDDPANLLNLAGILDLRGHTDEAIRTVRKALASQPDYPGAHAQLAIFDIRRDDPAAALRDAEKETDLDQKAYAVALAKQVGGDRAAADATLKTYIDKYGSHQPNYMQIAEMYALRKQPDAMFQWLQRGVAQHDLGTIGNLLQDSLLFPYHHDPRFAALCKQLGLPVPGAAPPAAVSTSSP
jgi:TolB-like protein/Tfp pilus assembly protein PilF